MNRSSGALVDYWDRQAATYDRRLAGAERRFLADSRRWVCGRARGTTLEIAIGTGANLRHYPDDVDLTGIDWSPAMVQAARRQADRVHRAVRLHQADATALPFPAGTFDTVVSTFALCCIPDERAALIEALRVLRPGGRLLLADHVAASFWPLRALQHAVDLISVPLQGEHYTRRPVTTLRGLGATIEETERLTMGAIERVNARKPH
ncbi:class I SAM-dependent methyltransferase [Microtetraspora sp. NBRC 16547]|uniref:class I SAM-dependent methyltransferase n=1 Tax=Microtetraspora sp. NBRC 16547 TaxID=3030993 RepID=UPI0024A4319E|nr:class I SAM-dependent methyltransferase [Microtetraspora sp. NBRC 16547]GLX02307.1 ubiquinone/menaquinone biosynthesis methyltransferase [Microtetraspora sp. NBRC 16547]